MVTNVDHFPSLAAREVVVTRVFAAPREMVFRAWTDPRRLVRWWAPSGCTTTFCRIDLRPGGAFHYCMHVRMGRDSWGIGAYREVVAPERLVYTDMFADVQGNPVSPAHLGMRAGHPAETLVTVTFAEDEGRTQLTLRQTILESMKEREAIRQSWSEVLDLLADDLSLLQGVTP